MTCNVCDLKISYYENKKIKYINCSYCNLKIYFCKECQSTRIIWHDLDVVCVSCGLVHEIVDKDSESIREDIPVVIN